MTFIYDYGSFITREIHDQHSMSTCQRCAHSAGGRNFVVVTALAVAWPKLG